MNRWMDGQMARMSGWTDKWDSNILLGFEREVESHLYSLSKGTKRFQSTKPHKTEG